MNFRWCCMVYDIIDLKIFIGSFGIECYIENFFYRMIKYL